jgi:hypothetical protein
MRWILVAFFAVDAPQVRSEHLRSVCSRIPVCGRGANASCPLDRENNGQHAGWPLLQTSSRRSRPAALRTLIPLKICEQPTCRQQLRRLRAYWLVPGQHVTKHLTQVAGAGAGRHGRRQVGLAPQAARQPPHRNNEVGVVDREHVVATSMGLRGCQVPCCMGPEQFTEVGRNVLFLSGVVCRVHVVDAPRPDPVNLNDGLLTSPSEVIGLRLHDCDAAGR